MVATTNKMTKIYDALISQALTFTDQNIIRAKSLVLYIDEYTKHDETLTRAIFEHAQSNKNQKISLNIMGTTVQLYSLAHKGDTAVIYHPNKVQQLQVIQGLLSAGFDVRAGEVIPIPPGKVCVIKNKSDVPVKAWSKE